MLWVENVSMMLEVLDQSLIIIPGWTSRSGSSRGTAESKQANSSVNTLDLTENQGLIPKYYPAFNAVSRQMKMIIL